VIVTLRDGRVERGMNDFPRGNPEYPVSTEALEDKFIRLVAHVTATRSRAGRSTRSVRSGIVPTWRQRSMDLDD
jgi:hypothetical protein